MKRSTRNLWPMLLVFGCSRADTPTTPAQPPAAGTPANPTPPAGTPTDPTPADTPSADPAKLKQELGELGIGVDGDYELRVGPAALTADGDFKPGVAERLARLKSMHKVMAIDLPAFGAGAGRALAAIPGLTRVDLWRTAATEEGIAALGGCPTIEQLDLNNGSGPNPVVSDAALAGLSKLKNLTRLSCEKGTITGAGLATLAGMTKLEELNLAECPIDDAAFPHLAKLTSLQELNLSGSKVTGAGLANLKNCPRLRRLNLNDTGTADTDLGALATLPNLSYLALGGTKVTDAGVVTLSKSKTFAALDLYDTKITDTGIIALAGMPHLQSLTLFRLPLTDASLEALAKAPELRSLWLADNKFTESGLAKFKAARPKVILQ